MNLLRRSHVPATIRRPLKPVGRALDRLTRPFGLAEYPLHEPAVRRRAGDVVFTAAIGAVIAWGIYRGVAYLDHTAGFGPFPRCLGLGFLTFLRVIILVVVSTIIWAPSR